MSKKDYVTVEQFRNFEVDYGSARCSGCDVYPPRSPAPIIINGKPYCLWCALELARVMLGRVGGKRELLADAKIGNLGTGN